MEGGGRKRDVEGHGGGGGAPQQKLSPASETTVYVDSDQEPSERTPVFVARETAMQALNTIVQVHFEKTLEKKRAVDAQKKELWKLFQFFFLFLAVLFGGVVQSSRLQCRHVWMPILICALAHAIFYVAMGQTLRCVNGFKYQRRCHKLTLGLATEKLKRLKLSTGDSVPEDEFEVRYQEPEDSYFIKFKRKWALFFAFLLLTFLSMVASMATLLCS
ncbi:hypothetical protein KP509_05G065900 [Ceratopteris richardii]|uniref:Transmembrane protein n=1 Tax=Ceratopteris richardii TaxID=49495 RepID=A0A8T2UUP5_CERRI|nr:hypothetical protein KP509_05G065900 [Ceratopteris richardii]